MTPEQADLLHQARRSLAAAKVLLEAGYPEVAVSRAYYVMFCCASALLRGEGPSLFQALGGNRCVWPSVRPDWKAPPRASQVSHWGRKGAFRRRLRRRPPRALWRGRTADRPSRAFPGGHGRRDRPTFTGGRGATGPSGAVSLAVGLPPSGWKLREPALENHLGCLIASGAIPLASGGDHHGNSALVDRLTAERAFRSVG